MMMMIFNHQKYTISQDGRFYPYLYQFFQNHGHQNSLFVPEPDKLVAKDFYSYQNSLGLTIRLVQVYHFL